LPFGVRPGLKAPGRTFEDSGERPKRFEGFVLVKAVEIEGIVFLVEGRVLVIEEDDFFCEGRVRRP
jgi:hypothetical protein